jgi:Mg2+/Co2+ transporter CorC
VLSDTAGGLVVELMGHIPQPGEKARLGRHEVTVLDAEPTRVRRLEVQEIEPEPGEGAEPAESTELRERSAEESETSASAEEPSGRPV